MYYRNPVIILELSIVVLVSLKGSGQTTSKQYALSQSENKLDTQNIYSFLFIYWISFTSCQNLWRNTFESNCLKVNLLQFFWYFQWPSQKLLGFLQILRFIISNFSEFLDFSFFQFITLGRKYFPSWQMHFSWANKHDAPHQMCYEVKFKLLHKTCSPKLRGYFSKTSQDNL